MTEEKQKQQHKANRLLWIDFDISIFSDKFG